MNGMRALVIAAIASFIVGCSVGLVSGVLIMRLGGPPPPFRTMRVQRPPDPGPRGDRMLSMLSRALDLSDDQRQRIATLIEDARHEQGASRDSLRARISRELTPDQRERWERFEMRFGRRDRRGPRTD
jgi:hypothetical protein